MLSGSLVCIWWCLCLVCSFRLMFWAWVGSRLGPGRPRLNLGRAYGWASGGGGPGEAWAGPLCSTLIVSLTVVFALSVCAFVCWCRCLGVSECLWACRCPDVSMSMSMSVFPCVHVPVSVVVSVSCLLSLYTFLSASVSASVSKSLNMYVSALVCEYLSVPQCPAPRPCPPLGPGRVPRLTLGPLQARPKHEVIDHTSNTHTYA